MKTTFKYVILLLWVLSMLEVRGQEKYKKSDINSLSYKDWPDVSNGMLSNDGNHVICKVSNDPERGDYYLIKSLRTHTETRFPSSYNLLNFTDDSKSILAMHGDTLTILNLGNHDKEDVVGCSSYEQFVQGGNQWLIYQLNNSQGTLVVWKSGTPVKYNFHNAKGYFLNPTKQIIVLKKNTAVENVDSLEWINLMDGSRKHIYYGHAASDCIFDLTGLGMAFTSDSSGVKSIWYYKANSSVAQRLLTDQADSMLDGYTISTEPYWEFSPDGNKIYFNQQLRKTEKLKGPGTPEIWNYMDKMIVPEYNLRGHQALHHSENFSVLDVKKRAIDIVFAANKKVLRSQSVQINNSVLVIQNELHCNKANKLSKEGSFELYFTDSKKCVQLSADLSTFWSFSEGNEYLVYFDARKRMFSRYEMKSGLTHDFSIDSEQFLECNILGWTDKKHLLVSGTYDIWHLDVTDVRKARNLTAKLNLKQEIAFSAAAGLNEFAPYKIADDILFIGFNLKKKNSSIYNLNIKSNSFSQVFQPGFFLAPPYQNFGYLHQSKNKSRYLFKIGNVSKFPNYYATSDFKVIDTITSFEPQDKYNWITSELLTYSDTSGRQYSGILYKPENFDSTKTYPVIFEYYRDQSNTLSKYVSLKPVSDGMNIPLLVSSGYIIMKPDIYTPPNEPGEGALNSVLAAVNYLGQFHWADTSRMAVNGSSFGGFETNYIITHTNIFKAAYSKAGVVNTIANYDDISLNGSQWQWYHLGVYNMKDSLQNIPDQYVKNSPILFTKYVKTPLLLVHNDEDHLVPVAHSIQFFNQLRSQGLPVWLLQYKGEKHFLNKEVNQLDLQDRVIQFFDHYLQDKAMPNWMIEHH